MLGSIATTVAAWLLKSRLSTENRLKLTNAILSELGTIQSSDVLTWSDAGVLHIQGREVDVEQARLLRESAKVLLNSPARNIVRKHVEFKAVTLGVQQAVSPEQMMFGKSAIWWGQEEDKIFRTLAGDDRELDPYRD